MTAIAADLSELAYRQAAEFLSSLDDDWACHIAAIGPCRHAAKPAREPYEALVRAIAYQQLHAKAGDAILGRFLALYPGTTFPAPQQVLATDEAALRGCGFSATKLATIRGIAQATLDGTVPTRDEALVTPDEALIDRLTTLRGVGRWTVEMLLIYTLERSDILPADDFGVRDGYRRLKRVETAPTRKQMIEIGRAWSPYRTIAAWYLWRMPSK
ncbi:DNA-3-methyladenine glycosylase family protein [Ralstonia sp. 25C]|uniref:DNA-3-methyladenine glycosylase family protein n=1 Tax=Ralstonia sp. 25C TaxID=3447363 RepID=UPI003F752F9C